MRTRNVVREHLAAMAHYYGYEYKQFIELGYLEVLALVREKPPPKYDTFHASSNRV